MKNKYQIRYYWIVDVEAENEDEAIIEADKIAKEDILSYEDLSYEIDKIKN